MARCALVEEATGAVISVIVASAGEPVPDGMLLIWIGDEPLDQGWAWTEDGWIAPAPPEVTGPGRNG